MKKIMAVLAAGVVFIALAMASCSEPRAVEEGPTVTLYFGGNSDSRAAVYPYTPLGGDGSFHSKIMYVIEFYLKETDIGQDHGGKQPVKRESAKGGTSAKIQLANHGTYNVYVRAEIGMDWVTSYYSMGYAELDGTREDVVIKAGSGIDHLEIDTTKKTSLTAPMKVENPIFWEDTSWDTTLESYIRSSSDPSVSVYVAVELNAANWAKIITAIDNGATGSKKVDLYLNCCSIPSKVFNPYPGNAGLAAGKAKINLLYLPLDAASIVSGPNIFSDFASIWLVTTDSVTSVGPNSFDGCTPLQYALFPNATSIGDSAFKDCIGLVGVNLQKATGIGNNAFAGCINLGRDDYEIELPEATSIGEGAFSGCTSLAILKIPKVETIGDNAFQDTGTTALSLYLGSTPPNLGTGLFPELTPPPKLVNIYVPTGTPVNDVYGYDYPYSIPTGPQTIDDGSYHSEWLRGLFGVGWVDGEAPFAPAYNDYSYSFNYYTPTP